jgi:Tol biopolymer transport system component
MRIGLLLVAGATVAATAAGPAPQTIVLTRVFPSPGQIGLFIASADGADEHRLVAGQDENYDAVWSPDGSAIIFTSDRGGSADLYRVKPDGSGFKQLTDSPAYDDQPSLSPDGRTIVFVSSRASGFANLWTIDVVTKETRALTTGNGGDFRPSWSPDGTWIAFSSDRGSELPFTKGRWERLQLADVYLIHPDGSGLKRITEHGNFCGSPKWAADSRAVIAYCTDAQKTLEIRRPAPLPGNDTRLVSIDIATNTATEVASGPGVKFNPSFVSGGDVGYIRKDTDEPGVYYTSGARGPRGPIRAAAWSPDGQHVVFHRRLDAPAPTWHSIWSRNPEYSLSLSMVLPSFSPDGRRVAMVERPQAGTVLASALVVADSGAQSGRVIYRDQARNVLGPQWSPSGDRIIFSVGVFNAFFNGFKGIFLKPGERAEGGAQVAVINADGSGFGEVTTGPGNNAFPSMAPDGSRFVYRTFSPDGGGGLRIMDLQTKTVTTLTEGYDNFPLWSPRGDLIMFSRLDDGNYGIFTIHSDGTNVKRLTNTRGNDAHQAWSSDGEHIVFASSRMGFKDEAIYADAPQPYGEIFVMRYDGTDVLQLTDNQWEDGTPAWKPNSHSR